MNDSKNTLRPCGASNPRRWFSPLCFGLLLSFIGVASGDVTVEVFGDDIVVTGSGIADELLVTEDGSGIIEIVGIEETRVNGVRVFNTGVVLGTAGELSLNMKGGNDEVRILFSSGGIQGDLIFRGGPGNDELIAEMDDIGGDVDVIMGGGNDEFRMVDVTVTGNLVFAGGAGADECWLGNENQDKAVVVFGDLDCRGGGSNDETIIELTTVFGDASIVCGGGSDEVIFDGSVVGNIDYRAGGGNDDAFFGRFGGIEIGGAFTFRGAGGADRLELGTGAGSFFANLGANCLSGNGRDEIIVGSNADIAGDFSANLGRGNDELFISPSAVFDAPGTLNGGPDFDAVNQPVADLIAIGFNVLGFEN